MSRKGNYWDNAVAESFFEMLKKELVDHESYKKYLRGTQELVSLD